MSPSDVVDQVSGMRATLAERAWVREAVNLGRDARVGVDQIGTALLSVEATMDYPILELGVACGVQVERCARRGMGQVLYVPL